MLKTFSISLIIISMLIVGFVIFAINNSKENKELKNVTIRLQWTCQSQFAGYYVAKELGFYEQNGLNVNIEEGGYAISNIKSVSENAEEFGNRWASDLVPYHKDLLIIANVFKKNGMILVSKKEKNISKLKDLVGKKISVWFIGNEIQLISLLNNNDIDVKSVTIVPQKFDISQFINDEVDVLSAMSYNELQSIYKLGYKREDLNIIDYNDYNHDFMGDCIFTSKEYYEKHPDICQAFVSATLKGWEYSIKHPEEATQIIVNSSKNFKLNYEEQFNQLKEIIKLIQVDKFEMGIVFEDKVRQLFLTFYNNKIIDNKEGYQDFYTNSLIKKYEESE